MSLLIAENISKSYSDKMLLSHVNISLNDGDKLGLIGINGTGKSTLLKIIAGVEKADEGQVTKGNNMQIAYLPQNPDFDEQATVLEQVFKGAGPLMNLVGEYTAALSNPATSSDQITRLTHDMDSLNAWNLESEVQSVLTKLGISDFNALTATLSGGQKKRIALAAALVKPADLLILDEPTNHLDNEAIDWLEQYLNKRKGSLLMITHDRYFLDRVVNQIIELDRGCLQLYKGNYSYYLEKKIEREEMEQSSELKRQRMLKKELAWLKQGAKARSTKQKARIERYHKLNSQPVVSQEEKLQIAVASSRLGKKTIELKQVSKSFDDTRIIDNFSFKLAGNDRIGIVGPNGSGKSTLLNIICGRVQSDSGTVDTGVTIKIGLFAQEMQHIDGSLRVIEYIKEGAELLNTADGHTITASQMLERFLFPPELQWSLIDKLSGGEKRRLYLLRVLMEAPNILLLDEPTNDLDIATLAILEDYLGEFNGAVLAVSHDRYFLDRIAKKILSFEGYGHIRQYTGNYSDYREKRSELAMQEDNKTAKAHVSASRKQEEPKETKKTKLKFTYQEQKEYADIDAIIAGLEEHITQLQSQINEATTDYVLLQQLLAEKGELDKQLQEKLDRWVYLNELAEKINSQA